MSKTPDHQIKTSYGNNAIRGEDLPPLHYLQEIYDKVVSVSRFLNEDGGTEKEKKKIFRRLRIIKWLARIGRRLNRFEGLFSYFIKYQIEILSSHSHTPELIYANLPMLGIFKSMLAQFFENDGKPGKPVVWLEWCLSTEIIHAFDALPIIPEILAVAPFLISGPDGAEIPITFAEQSGVPVEYCSGARSAVGACLTKQLPDPVCIVTAAHPCDSMTSSYQTLEYLTGAPTYRLDTPFWDDEKAIDNFTEDVKSLILFLEKHLDRKLDYDRLRELINEVNKTNDYLIEINEMNRLVPCPGSQWVFIYSWLAREIGRGLPEVTEVARRLHSNISKNAREGRGSLKKEKIRVIWFDVPIVFYPVINWMEETFGAVVVIDLIGYVDTPQIDTSSRESMIRGLAESYMNVSMARQFRGTLDLLNRDLHRVCSEYSGDCFIFTGHAGCKHGWASLQILKREMEAINMPLLTLTSDIFDVRMTNEKKLMEQIEEFFITNGLVK